MRVLLPTERWKPSGRSVNWPESSAFLSGMSAIVTDTKNLAEKETPLYVLIAVVSGSDRIRTYDGFVFYPVTFYAEYRNGDRV